MHLIKPNPAVAMWPLCTSPISDASEWTACTSMCCYVCQWIWGLSFAFVTHLSKNKIQLYLFLPYWKMLLYISSKSNLLMLKTYLFSQLRNQIFQSDLKFIFTTNPILSIPTITTIFFLNRLIERQSSMYRTINRQI